METIIIYCHPKDLKKENKLLKIIVSEIELIGDHAKIYNIIGDVFSPNLMNSDQVELRDQENVDLVIDSIRTDLSQDKQLIFLFPYYWEGITSYLRRFINKVFLTETENGRIFATNKNLKHIKAIIITSMRVPQILFSSRTAGGYTDPLTISILKLCGIRNIQWFNISKWSDKNARVNDKKLDQIREYLHSI